MRNKKVIIFGASQSGNKALRRLEDFDIQVEGFIDNDKAKWGKTFSERQIFSPDDIFSNAADYIIIIASVYEKEIKEQCISAGVSENQVYVLEDFIIRKTNEYMENYKYLDNIKPVLHDEKTLIITVPNKDGEFSGVTSWMYATGAGLAECNKPYIIVTEDAGNEMPIETYPHVVFYNSYAFEENTGNGIRLRRGNNYSKLYRKETDSLIHIMMQHMPCTIITSETYGAEYVAAYILKKKFPEYVRVVSVVHSDERARYLRGIWHEKDLDGYLCISLNSVSIWEEKYNVPKQKLFYHDMPINLILKEHIYSTKDETIKIGYLGRLEVNAKRCDLLIKLIEQLEENKVNYILNIAGIGDYEQNIREFISEHKLENKVILQGFISHDKVNEFWSDKDICILMSDFEGTSISMLEGMISGAVPMVTDVSCARNFIEDGVNGYIVPIGDYVNMAERIKYLADNRDRVCEFGKLAKEEVVERCTPVKYARYLLEMQNKIWK